MLGPYHQGDLVDLLQWNGNKLISVGLFTVTDGRCKPPRKPKWKYVVCQTYYSSVK